MSDTQDPSLLPLDAVPWRGAIALVRAAVRRHWFMATVIVSVFVAVAGTAAALLPRVYSGELRMLARRGTSVMSAISDPRRAVAPGFDAPSQGAVALGLSRTAIIAIVKDGGLVDRWQHVRPTVMRLKDDVRVRLHGPLPQAELEDAIVAMLEERLKLRVAEDVITISVTWYDPESVQIILNAAQQAFIKERSRLDIESIEASYAILQRATTAMSGQMEGRVSAFQSARSRALGDKAAKIPVKVSTVSLSELRDQLLERRAYREELERRRRNKRADLRVQLSQQEATFGARHPDRINTEQALARLDGDDEGLTAARAAEDVTLKEYRARGGSLDILDANSSTEKSMDPNNSSPDDDPTVIAAR